MEVAVLVDPHAGAEHADRRDAIVEAARQRRVRAAAWDAEVVAAEVRVLEEARALARIGLAAPGRRAGIPAAVAEIVVVVAIASASS